MPSSDRTYAPARGTGVADPDLLRRALDVLCDPSLAHVVDLVAYADGDEIEVANSAGRSRWRRDTLEVSLVEGRDPVANQDALAFTPLEAERPHLTNAEHHYPFARERLTDLLGDRRAPDIAVVHTAAHHWPERGGHLGEHGSLNAVQSRAPLMLSGAGVRARGVLPRTARVRDVGPALARLAGSTMRASDLDDLAEPGARHVVGLLWDGVNANDVLYLAQTGELPAVARLLADGCALQGGAIAEFPSITLTNHTSALTGLGPGGHGILNNTFYDRYADRQVVANDSSTWHVACDELSPGVETVFEVLARTREGVVTACVNEPVDRGAAYTTFGLVRAQHTGDGAKGMTGQLPDPKDDPLASADYLASKDYHWGSAVDGMGLAQVRQLWSSASRPDFMWWNTTLTDAAHHEGGPHSEVARASLRDADTRLGAFLELLDSLGAYDDTAFLLTSDHGSEAADPDCRGDWDGALRAAGIPFRDEAYGFLYLG